MSDTQVQHDGSIDDAARVMPDIPDDYAPNPSPTAPSLLDVQTRDGRAEEAPISDRDAQGRFKSKDAIPGDNAKPNAPDADVKAAEPEEDDYLELPAEAEGQEPVRLKVADVYQGYTRAKELEAELTKVKSQPVLPAEVEQALTETVRMRSQYMDGLKQLNQLYQLPPPDENLINPNSANYDPNAYWQQVNAYKQSAENSNRLKAHYQQENQKQSQEQEALRVARWQRERAKLEQIWPEALDVQKQAPIRQALDQHYGIDDALLSSDVTLDHRFYALAKDALAYRESQAKAAVAVKVVRTAPKLVRGSQRQTNSSQQRVRNDGLSRLQQTGSIDDAVAAMPDF